MAKKEGAGNGANGDEDIETQTGAGEDEEIAEVVEDPTADETERKAVEVICMSLTPLLLHGITKKGVVDIARKAPAETVTPRCTYEEAIRWMTEHASLGIPRDPETSLYGIPARYLSECLIGGGRHVDMGARKKLSTAKKSLVSVFLEIVEPFLPFPDFAQRRDGVEPWTLDIDHGWGQTGTFVAIARPEFMEWAFKTTVVFQPKNIPESKVRALFEVSGTHIGIGGHRPDCRGGNGQFGIGGWRILDEIPAGAKANRDLKKAAEACVWTMSAAESVSP